MIKHFLSFFTKALLIICVAAINLASECSGVICPDSNGNHVEISVMRADGTNVTENHFGQGSIFTHAFSPSNAPSRETLRSNSGTQTVEFFIDGNIEYMNADCGMQHLIKSLTVKTTFRSFELTATDEKLSRWRLLLFE